MEESSGEIQLLHDSERDDQHIRDTQGDEEVLPVVVPDAVWYPAVESRPGPGDFGRNMSGE